MQLGAAGLQEQPFRVHGKPLTYVSYVAHDAAHEFLREVCKHPTGIGLLKGPRLSGKTTVLRSFAATLGNDAEVAFVDGAGLNTTTLLSTMLSQFGFQLEFSSMNELLNMLKVFVLQRTASTEAPLLIIENAHAMNPSALRMLCELANLKVRQRSALRMLICSDHSMDSILRTNAMSTISSRVIGEYVLGPLTEYEATDYLYAKLRAGGCVDPENVIPDRICDELHSASGGWPGILDRLVLLALAKAPHCPLASEHVERPVLPDLDGDPASVSDQSNYLKSAKDDDVPRLFLTMNGKTLKEIRFDRPRIIIGRSEHNDLRLNAKYISRHHAIFIRHGMTTLLMDLNSTNGTYVNSKRVSNQVMMHNDVVSLGNHRIKFVHAGAQATVDLEGDGVADTVIMKSLEDMRNMLARENTHVMPIPPDEIVG